jgi:SAM-dependent methyltransferase
MSVIESPIAEVPVAERPCQLCDHRPLERFDVVSGPTLWRCPSCGLYQYGNLVDSIEYEGDYHRGYALHIRRKQLAAASRISRVAAVVDCESPRLLDVGCSIGATVAAAGERGWRASGVDVSRDAIRSCRRRGLDCRVVDDFELPFPDGSFDVVTSWHVIEHVDDVQVALAEWRRVLRPGGILAMETPDASSRVVRQRGTSYRRFWAPEHTYTFTPQTLTDFVERAGLELLPLPTFGRLTDLPFWKAGYAVGRETLLLLQRWLGRHKAFQIFARRPVEEPSVFPSVPLSKVA